MLDEVRNKILEKHGTEDFRIVLEHLEEIEQLKLEGFKLNKIAEHFGFAPDKFYAALRKARRINEKMNLSNQQLKKSENTKGKRNESIMDKSANIAQKEQHKKFTREEIRKMTPQEKVVLFDQTEEELAEFNIDLSNL